MIVMEGAHARITPHYVSRRNRPHKIFRGRRAEISNFLGGRDDLKKIAGKVLISGADQCMGALIRYGEHDAAVRILKHIGVAMTEELRRHDVGALDEAHAAARRMSNARFNA